jgi:GNAT superfamily N-acetyltransferase
MSDYRFERLNESNFKDLVFLYKHSFGLSPDLNFLKKKYDTQSFGLNYIGFIAYSNTNEPAAYYGVFPFIVTHLGTEYIAAQSGDTMTHPNHRGKGLFIALAKQTYELAKQEGITFVFGFPNENSFPGFIKKLEWTHYANVNNYGIKTGTLPFDKVAKKFSVLNGLYQNYVSSILDKLSTAEGFENSLVSRHSQVGAVLHDARFIQYKTYSTAKIITVAGKKCWIKIDGRIWIGDIEACNEEQFLAVLDALKHLAKKLLCSSIQFSIFEGSDYDLFLKKIKEPFYKNPVGYLNLNAGADGAVFGYQGVDFDTY